MMIIAIVTIIAGMPFGFLLKNNRLMQEWTGKALNLSVWILLFLLGIGLGVDESLMGQLDTLGLQALLISFFATFGTLVGAWFLGRYVFSDSLVENTSQGTISLKNTPLKNISYENEKASLGKAPLGKAPLGKAPLEKALLEKNSNGKNSSAKSLPEKESPKKNSPEDGEKLSKFNALKDSAVVLLFFAGGVLLGIYPIIPTAWASANAAAWALYVLLFLAGMSVGFDLKAFRILRDLKSKILLVPFVTILGTLLASPLACFVFPDLRIIDAVVVGAGLGYYSLSSTMISQEISPALGSVALLSNMLREIFTLIFTPLMVRYFGRLGPVMAGGATSNDSSLPVIAKYCGERYAIIAIFSGVFLTLVVPLLVSFILSFS